MPAETFLLPFRPAIDPNGLTVSGAQLYFYASGTSTPQNVYADEALTVPLMNPVMANAAGKWPTINLDNTLVYRVVLRDGEGVILSEADPYVVNVTDPLEADLQAFVNAAAAQATNAGAQAILAGIQASLAEQSATLAAAQIPLAEAQVSLAAGQVGLAAQQAAAAGASAGYAEEFFAGISYTTVSDGEAATTPGHFFRVPIPATDPVEYTRYQRTEAGSVIAAPLATTAHLASEDGAEAVGFVQAVPGAVAKDVQAKLRERLSILDFCTPTQRADILSGTGAVDVSSAWQAALGALGSNQQLDLVGGVHRLNSAVSTSGKSRIRIIGNGAQIVEGTPGIASLVSLTSCPRAWVQDIHFVASETYAYFAANAPTDRHRFLTISSSVNPRVENVTGESKRGHIYMLNCTGAIVEKSHFIGFLQNVSLGQQANSNECTSVEFSGGANNKALYCYARNHGSVVLWGANGEAPLTVGCDGRDLHDNGIYLSSGSRGRSFGNDFKSVYGSCVKHRGSLHVAFGNTGEDAGVGMSMTGDGATPDAYGANGHGNITALNSFKGIRDDAILAFVQDTLYQRDGIIALNALSDLTNTGANGAIRSQMTQGGLIAFNAINDVACQYAILSVGTASLPQKAHVIFGNSIQNHTGTQQGIRAQYVQSGLIAGNVGSSVPNLIQGRNVTNSLVAFNANPGGTTALSLSAGNSNTDNLVIGMRGVSSIDGATHSNFGNYPASTLTAPSVAPKSVGQITVQSGIGYVATGVASSADWKQIT